MANSQGGQKDERAFEIEIRDIRVPMLMRFCRLIATAPFGFLWKPYTQGAFSIAVDKDNMERFGTGEGLVSLIEK